MLLQYKFLACKRFIFMFHLCITCLEKIKVVMCKNMNCTHVVIFYSTIIIEFFICTEL